MSPKTVLASFPITNFGGPFDRYISTSLGLEETGAWEKWREWVEIKASAYFQEVVGGSGDHKGGQGEYRASFNRSLPYHRQFRSEILAEFSGFEAIFRSNLGGFADIFADIGTAAAPVYAVPSLLRFNGQRSELNGQPVLSFGIDMIVALRAEPGLISGMRAVTDTGVICAHEIFHLYHFRKMKLSKASLMQTGTMLHAAWVEGLATYASGLINPNQSTAAVLMDAELSEVSQTKMGELLHQFTKIASFTLSAAQTQVGCRGWFQAPSDSPSVPARAGYVVGLEIAKRASTSYSLEQMANWGFEEIPLRLRPFMG